jgi:hypothetical protein
MAVVAISLCGAETIAVVHCRGLVIRACLVTMPLSTLCQVGGKGIPLSVSLT